MKTIWIPTIFLFLCAFSGTSWGQYDIRTIKDVVQLVEAAGRHERAYEWDGECVPEIDQLAKHGQSIVPLLVALLNHADAPKDDFDMHIGSDQQIQLALYRVLKERPQLGINVYGVRVLPNENLKVKEHWERKAKEVQH